MNYKKIKLTNLTESKNDNLIVIKTPFIQHLLLPTFFTLVFIWVFVSGQSSYFTLPIIILLAFLIYKIWMLFDSVNVIKVNKEEDLFIVTSRNIIKWIFVSDSKIPFQEIIKFEVKEGPEIMLEPTRFIIYAVLKDSTIVLFTSTANKTTVNEIMDFFNSLITFKKPHNSTLNSFPH